MSVTSPELQRRMLGDFLRNCRTRLEPAAVGLPIGGRRRTRGLRREEVALLAGISATWFTWLEQGREVAASPHALARLADALRLSRAERAYLFQLAGRHDPQAGQGADPALAMLALLRQTVQALSVPAYAMDHRYTMLAWNGAAEALFTGWLDQPSPHNMLRFLFLDPAARTLVVDWRHRTRRVLAELRADYSRHLEDQALIDLLAELRAGSATFAEGWRDQTVLDREGGERRFNHPTQGPLTFQQLTFALDAAPDHRLVVLHPV
ncbi:MULTISPECIES: helix-turn-helix transcriptional regulator [unclassified Azospirillum]|uniref:helix-turn-helix transcriptional regulator n=1 Tax=unclassified Azospirillum TaxID=2630922 RepID=UPI000B6FA58C|nr:MULTISPECIES: helix-turn-helix transcriptional regulator [unclassified Azospirillum]SNT13543.1 transcriptional regulator, XRE family [Azospirillum sp. RU38E]SNT26993.1 transcriptional regulator, XRE family [Azospirillum sp. RU37A]